MELVINTYGVCLNRENETFIITTPDGKQRIPVEGVSSIQISKGAQITSDAILLAIEHEIQIVFATNDGTPMGRVWSPRYGSISTIRKGQLAFTYSHAAVDWIKEVLCKKIDNQQALLLTMSTGEEPLNDYHRDKAIARMEDYKTKIHTADGDIVNDIAPQLRGWEGLSAKIYFECINRYLPEHYRFKERSHPALDVANALLNYGYGMLYGKIEGCLIKAGIDPYVGVLHRDDYNRPVLAYDVIELYRMWVEYVVFSLLCQNTAINDEYYSVRSDGTYWLEPLGRRVLIQSINDYLEDVTTIKGVARSREQQMFLYSQSLAQKFKTLQT